MADNFSSVNQAPQGATPQFQQTQAVSDGLAQSVGQVASMGATVFQSAAKASAASQKSKAETAEATALGGLQQKLLDIRQAGETSDIDVTREQRKAMSKFNSEFPSLRLEGSKAFKAETGVSASAESPEEAHERKMSFEALDNGYGRHGASEEYNAEQKELYIQTKRADSQNSARLQELNLKKTRGEMSNELVKKEVLGSFREMSGLAYKKTSSDSANIISSVSDGTMSIEDANLSIREKRIELNRAVASLGEYSTDDAVQAYMAPILDELKLAEDVVNGVIEMDASKSIIAINKARSQAIFYSDVNRVNLAVTSEIFGHTVGFTNVMTAPAYKFLSDGLTKDGMVPSTPKPVDPTKLDEDSKKGITGTTNNVLTSTDEVAKQEVGAMLAGVSEHLSRNGMDYDVEDKDFVIQLLSTPKAMEQLSPQQKEAVMMGFEMYVVDDTKLLADQYVSGKQEVRISSPIARWKRSGADAKTMADVADITVVDGRLFWTIKPEFATDGTVQYQVRTTNRTISDKITPVLNILSKGSGQGFEAVTQQVVFGVKQGGEEETKKPQ